MLAQEIITDIRKRIKTVNMVIKLDMAKDYDRVEWRFLIKVLEQMGFSNTLTDMVWRLLDNNWYSILINGQSQGFFNSSIGVKQGDPLSPDLFIMAAEVLSRELNSLFSYNGFRGFSLPKWSDQINYLAYYLCFC